VRKEVKLIAEERGEGNKEGFVEININKGVRKGERCGKVRANMRRMRKEEDQLK
jgi:hypothetical protein